MANIIVTGVSTGIGLELCRYFLLTGEHTVAGISRNSIVPMGIEEMRPHKGARYLHHTMDITQPTELAAFRNWLQREKLTPDVLINNAGMMLHKPFAEITPEEADRVLEVNFKAPFMLMQTILPLMESGGHIVNITSMGGVMGSVKFPGLSLYSASKGALSVLTEALAEELRETGIRVNALALGAVQTGMLEQTFPGYKAPLNPEEMAEFIGDFALKGHRYFNGKVLQVATTTP